MATKKDNNNDSYEFQGNGLIGKEHKDAKKKFKEYVKRYSFEKLSDLELLEMLIFRETLHQRTLTKIAELTKTSNEIDVIPSKLMSSLDESLETILKLKEKLGLMEEKIETDFFTHIQTLKKKFKIWMEENQGSRTFTCPHCQNMIMLTIRAEAWKALKHPFFKDKILANPALMKLYKDKVITKAQYASVIGTADDYVDWIIENVKFD